MKTKMITLKVRYGLSKNHNEAALTKCLINPIVTGSVRRFAMKITFSIGILVLLTIGLAIAFVSPTFAKVSGDFNGDGFEDLAIGVPREDVDITTDAGAVHVLYGSATGLQASGIGGPNDQLWSQNSYEVKDASEGWDSFGNVLAVGDFNKDGKDDLAIGVPNEDVGTVVDAGAVNVLYGSATGLQASGSGGPDDQLWSQNSSGVESDPESGDRFGSVLAMGDFNKDGFEDLAIGVPGEDVGTIYDAGAVQVLYGSSTGLSAGRYSWPLVWVTPKSQIWHQDSSGVYDASETADFFGSSLAVGDFNKDGIEDLAIGVPGEDVGTLANAGAVNVLYGSATGLQASGSGGPNDQLWSQDSYSVNDISENYDGFGNALAVGDFNKDGIEDLAIGVPYEDVGTIADAGAVNVLYGSYTGLQATGTGGPDDRFWYQGNYGILDTPESFDNFGAALTVGDFNRDGFEDLAIGIPYEDVGTTVDVGSVNVLYGSATGLQASGTGGPNDQQLWSQDSYSVNDISENYDGFGCALAVGDFNKDGFNDLAIGVPGEDVGTLADAGTVNVLYGSATGLQASGTGGPNDQLWLQGYSSVSDMAENKDGFGSVLGGDNNCGYLGPPIIIY